MKSYSSLLYLRPLIIYEHDPQMSFHRIIILIIFIGLTGCAHYGLQYAENENQWSDISLPASDLPSKSIRAR